MSSGRNILFPRAFVAPRRVAERVRQARSAKGWTQRELASAIGCARRTVIRIEAGTHRPSSHLVHALEAALEIPRLVPGWMDAASPDEPSFGPRCRVARLAAGVSQMAAAEAAGVSAATMSRFEREMGDTPRIVSLEAETIINDGLAVALGFPDAAALDRYCMTSAPDPTTQP